MDTQADLISRIAQATVLSPDAFDSLLHPAIERFAAFVHLLPASQSHHHRGAGGLFRHSLEVGLWALQLADKVLLDAQTPSHRRMLEPRWQLAVFLAALCHDAGKPVTDVVVTDHGRTSIWKPLSESLYDWTQHNKVNAYFLEWRDGRARQHTALSSLIAERIIGAETLSWIQEGGTDLVVWLMESLAYNPGPTNRIHDLVVKADQASVERDLQTIGVAMAGYDIGVPVERYLIDIMRQLLKEGTWLVNEPGARLWNIEGHLYLVWPAAGEDMARRVRDEGIPGIPRTPDGILDMLVERQMAYLRDDPSCEDPFWKIAPACLAEKIADIRLSAIRLRDDSMLSSVPIPPVEGRVLVAGVGDETPPNPSAASSMDTAQNVQEAISQPAPSRAPEKQEASARSVQTEARLTQTLGPDPGSKGERELGSGRDSKMALDGPVGEALKALAEDIRSGAKRLGADAFVDPSGHLLLAWPDAFAGYGLTPKHILDELVSRGWLSLDPMAPLRKVVDWPAGDTVIKAVRLEREVSAILIGMMGKAADAQSKPARVETSRDEGHGVSATRSVNGKPARKRSDAASGLGKAPPSQGRGESQRAVSPRADGEADSASRVHETPQGATSTAAQDVTIETLLAALDEIPGIEKDGWRFVMKSAVMSALRRKGLRLTHGALESLIEQSGGMLVMDGGAIKRPVRNAS